MSSWHPDRRCHCQPVPTVTDADLMSTGLSPEGVVLLRVISKSLGGGGIWRLAQKFNGDPTDFSAQDTPLRQ